MRIGHVARAAVCALALGAGITACGDDEDDGGGGAAAPATTQAAAEPATLAVDVTGTTKAPKIEATPSIPAGLVRIEVTSSLETISSAQLVRFDEGHTAAEANAAGDAWGDKGKPLPDWVHLEGGVATKTGETAVATQALTAGTYAVIGFQDGDDAPDDAKDAIAEFEVTDGEAGGELPTAPATVTMKDYAFEATGLKAGKQQVLVENVGKQPHFIVALPLLKGKTIADARAFFATEEPKTPPPADFDNGSETSVLDGGGKQVVELDLKAGTYAFVCFIPDRAGGPPHVAKGMISPVEVQ